MSDAPAAPTLGERVIAAGEAIRHGNLTTLHSLAYDWKIDLEHVGRTFESQNAEIARQAAQLKAAEYSAKTWERAAEQADEREAAATARNARLTEALREIAAEGLRPIVHGNAVEYERNHMVTIATAALLDAQPEQAWRPDPETIRGCIGLIAQFGHSDEETSDQARDNALVVRCISRLREFETQPPKPGEVRDAD